jgi:hypothetical protein
VSTSLENLVTNNGNKVVIEKLLENSKAAIMSAVELHNKPMFHYRYEIAIILTINAWELALKAYILTYLKEIKVSEGDWSKEFPKCLLCVESHLGKKFHQQKASIELLYDYRCKVTHFYADDIELILYSLLRPNILYFSDFLLKYFEIDVGKDANLIVLPIGFKRMISPIDFLSKNSSQGSEPVKEFIKDIMKSVKTLKDGGFEDGLLFNYSMGVENANRIKYADVIAGISKDEFSSTIMINKTTAISGFTIDPNAPKVQIEESSFFKEKFNITTKILNARLKQEVENIKFGKKYNSIISEIKQNINFFAWRYLDIYEQSGGGSRKGYYSEEGYREIVKLYNFTES